MEDRILNTGSVGAVVPRNRVLRNTYGLLALSLLPTIAGAMLGIQTHFGAIFPSGFVGFAIFMGVAFGFIYGIERTKQSSMGVFLLLGFTFFMGLMLSGLLEHTLRFSNGGSLIAIAGGGTALAFFGLSAIASSTKRDLSNMQKFLSIGSLLIIGAMVANIFFQVPALTLTILVAILGISCAWLVVDINRIVNGGETNYVSATLGVYISLFNIFQTLLALLGIFGGDRD